MCRRRIGRGRGGRQRSAHLLGELVGLALAQHDDVPDGVEPAPGECRAPAAPCAAPPVFHPGRRLFRARLARLGLLFSACGRGLKRVSSTTLQSQVDRMREHRELGSSSLRKETAALDATRPRLCSSAISDRGVWLRILDDLNARLPKENIWITELAPTSGGRIVGEDRAGRSVNAGACIVARRAAVAGATDKKNVPMIDGVFVQRTLSFQSRSSRKSWSIIFGICSARPSSRSIRTDNRK